jgi:hypothetical protein
MLWLILQTIFKLYLLGTILLLVCTIAQLVRRNVEMHFVGIFYVSIHGVVHSIGVDVHSAGVHGMGIRVQ